MIQLPDDFAPILEQLRDNFVQQREDQHGRHGVSEVHLSERHLTSIGDALGNYANDTAASEPDGPADKGPEPEKSGPDWSVMEEL